MRLPFFVGMLFLIMFAACARPPTANSLRPRAALAACNLPVGWTASQEGEHLRTIKQQLNQGWDNPSDPDLSDTGDWAYPSIPQDIPGDGKYTFDFGPVDPSFNWPKSPSSVGFEGPWTLAFRLSPQNAIHMADLSTGRYLEVTFFISNAQAGCKGYVMWIY